MKALLPFSQSNFETGCFQARVKLAPPYLGDEVLDELLMGDHGLPGVMAQAQTTRVQVQSILILLAIKR